MLPYKFTFNPGKEHNVKLIKLVATALLAVGLGTTTLYAAQIIPSITYLPGTTYNTTALSTYTTGGADMDGMILTAYFSNGVIETATWTDTAVPNAGSATGTGWSVSLSGVTTFGTPWYVTNSNDWSLMRLVIDGKQGDTVFDVLSTDYFTPDSALGMPISSVNGPSGLSVSATYLNQLSENNIWYGDLYTMLELNFLSASGEGGLLGTLSFNADTDNVAFAGDITPTVPEPTTLSLLGLGLIGLLGLTRYRQER